MADDSDAEFLKRLEALTAAPSTGESAERGALLGGTMGWAPKIAAGIDTATSYVPGLRDVAQQFHDPRFPPISDSSPTFAQRLAGYQQANRAAREEHPNVFGGAEAGAGALSTLAVPGGAATAGALGGAGYDESATLGGKLGSTLKGAALGLAAEKVAGGLTSTAEKAAESNATLLRRELAGPGIGSSAGAKEARASTYKLGQTLNREVESVEGLPAAIRGGDRREQAAIANRVTSQLSQANDEIYSHAQAKSPHGGVSYSDVVTPLRNLSSKMRSAGQTGQAAVVDKLIEENVYSGMFGGQDGSPGSGYVTAKTVRRAPGAVTPNVIDVDAVPVGRAASPDRSLSPSTGGAGFSVSPSGEVIASRGGSAASGMRLLGDGSGAIAQRSPTGMGPAMPTTQGADTATFPATPRRRSSSLREAVADPRDVRSFISNELQGNKKQANLTLAEKDEVAAREKAGVVLKERLSQWVREHAGEEMARKLEANNRKISSMVLVQKAATEGGFVQEMGAPKAPAGGMVGALKAKAGELGTPLTRFSDTPAGQGLLWGAAKASKALPAPLLDAFATKDPDVAKKAIADDLFGGAP